MSFYLSDSEIPSDDDLGPELVFQPSDSCNMTQDDDDDKDNDVRNLIDDIQGIGEGTRDDREENSDIFTEVTENSTVSGIEDQTQKSGINNQDYYEKTIKGTLDDTINSVSAKLLDSKAKTNEIERFKTLLKEFGNWFLSNERIFEKEFGSSRYEYSEETSPVSAYEFVIYDNHVNAFTLPFSDIYINLIALKKVYKRNALEYMRRYLRDMDPNAYIQEFLSDPKRTRRKIIFRFLDGKTKFIIMVNIELHLRLHMQFKLCTNIDRKFLLIGAFLSFWAHKRGILKDEYLNSNTLYLMLIYFLQVQQPPILPNLYNKDLGKITSYQKKSLKGITQTYEVKVDQNYEPNVHNLKSKLTAENTKTVAELVTRFFYMFAFDIPALKKRISIKKGRLIDHNRKIDGYSVEDPYIEDFDTCRNLNKISSEAYTVVLKEFRRAYELIADGRPQELCYEFKG